MSTTKVKKQKKAKEYDVGLIKTFMFLLKSVREYKKDSFLTILFISFESILECIMPFVTGALIDTMNKVNTSSIMNTVLMYAGILVGLATFSLICGLFAGRFAARAGVGFAKNLRQDVFYKVQTFSFENIDHFQVSSLVTRETTDISNIQMSYMMIIRTAVRSPLMLVFSIIMSVIQCPELSWIFAITIPILLFGLIAIIYSALPAFNKVFKKYDKLNESIEENVRGMRVVKTYCREEYEKEKFKGASHELQKGFLRGERIVVLNNPLMQFSMYLSMILFISIGTTLILKTSYIDLDGEMITPKLSIGQLQSLITYSTQVLSSLMMLSMVLVVITISTASMHRVYEVLNEKPTMVQNETEQRVTKVADGSIDFNNVSFKYDPSAEEYALKDIDLHIKSGQTIGIIGGTGSSKSTLVNLISRFYDVTVGSIKVGGVDVKDYDIHALRNNIGMVLQKNILFAGTIKENLLWGNKEASLDDIKEAAHIAQADSFIDAMPDGYDSRVEQGGSNFSGGQKQRLCIARALLKKPKIIVFDDSTSAVDTKTDSFIRKGLNESLPNCTKIIIAQRVASVEDADFIIVLDNGTINGIGTSEELIKTNAIYKEVYELQNRQGGEANE